MTGSIRLAAFLACVAVISGLWILLLTPQGPAVSPDSAAYVGGAENLAHGRGLTLPFVPRDTNVSPLTTARLNERAPLYQYSPLLPALLAPAVKVGVGAEWAALYLNALLCGVTTVLVAWAAMRLSGHWLPAVIAVGFLLTSQVFLDSFTSVSTEALFLPLVLGALIVLARYLDTTDWRLAAAFVVLAAGASLARIVGVTVIATGVIAVLVWPSPKRFLRAAVIGAVSIVPIALWSVWQSRHDLGGAGDIVYHRPAFFGGLARALDSWLTGTLAGDSSELVRVVALVIAVALAVSAAVVLRGTFGDRALVRVSWLFPAVYAPVLYLTITFVVASTPFGVKYLVPVLPPLLVLAVAAAWKLRNQTIVLVVLAVVAIPVVVRHAEAGRDAWAGRNTPSPPLDGVVYRDLKRLPTGVPVFTNEPDRVYLATGRFGVTLPPHRSVWSGEKNGDYEKQVSELAPALCRTGGVVFIDGGKFAGFQARALKSHGLVVARIYPEGIVMRPNCP